MQKTSKAAADKSATIVSNLKACANGTGIISPESPTINKILKILLPTMLPIAISEFFFNAAETDVKSSGSEVPSATIVSPINLSLNHDKSGKCKKQSFKQ